MLVDYFKECFISKDFYPSAERAISNLSQVFFEKFEKLMLEAIESINEIKEWNEAPLV